MSETVDRRSGVSWIPARRLWLASTLVLLLFVLAVAVHLLVRKPAETTVTVPAPVVPSADETLRLRQLEALNQSLEAEIAKLGHEPSPLACPPGTVRRVDAPPSGRSDGASSSNERLPPNTPTTPSGSAPAGGPTGAVATKLASAELVERLERATVLVLTESSIATGFFIDNAHLVTNRHAVQDAADGRVLIASRSLGQVRPGTVVGSSATSPVGGIDFAIVRITGPGPSGILPVTTSFGKLSNVTAAGYPGLTVMNDAGFRKMIAGDAHASPDLNVTQGAVQAINQLPNGGTAIVHTASILQGNSGGPLVDGCGRVIGVNTFIAVDKEQSGRISFAQPSTELLRFLQNQGMSMTPDTRACE